MLGVRNWSVRRKTMILAAVGIILFAAAAVAGSGLGQDGSPVFSTSGKTAGSGGAALGVPSAAPAQGPAFTDDAREFSAQNSPAAESKARGASADASSYASSQGLPLLDRMIVYTTSITMTVQDVAPSMDQVTELIRRNGGYVSGSSVRQEGELTYATLLLKVPASAYQDTMAALRRLSITVPTEQGQSKDVTEEFSDLDAQVRNLQATEAQFQELMKKAVTIDEILRVQTQLSNVRGQIERLKGRMNYLQRNADEASVTVNLVPVAADKRRPNTGAWDPLRIANEAWDDSLRFLQVWADRGIRVVVFSWWLAPFALAGLMLWSNRSSRRRTVPQQS